MLDPKREHLIGDVPVRGIRRCRWLSADYGQPGIAPNFATRLINKYLAT